MANHEATQATTPASPPWSSRWKAPALMLLGILAGVGFGVGHHAYYQSYNNTIVQSTSQQQWAIRIGTGLAFLTKTAFTVVVGIAFSQYLWVVVRMNAQPLQSLNTMFAMTTDPMSFFNRHVLAHAKLLTIIGIISWLLPLVALVTPATLTVESRVTTNVTNRDVPYPRFDNFTDDVSPNMNRGNAWSDYQGAGFVNKPSPALSRLLSVVSSGMSIVPVSAPYTNSSYSMRFHGPCLKCQSAEDAIRSTDFDYLEHRDYLDGLSLSKLWADFHPVYDQFYYAARKSINLVMVKSGPTFRRLASGRTMKEADGVNITCQFRNASYAVDFTFLEGIASTTISKLELEPVLDYDISTQFYRMPNKGARAYVSMFEALATLLSGEVAPLFEQSSGGMQGGHLSFVTTGLLACPEIVDVYKADPPRPLPPLNETTSPWMCRNGSLQEAIEDLSHNFTLSLLSSAVFSTNRTVDVSSSSFQNYYHYQPESLAISYLASLGVGVVCFLIGTWACYANGYSATTSFSTILHTTRNPQLDNLTKASEGTETLSKTLKLQYGIVHQLDGTYHAAFGPADKITPIKR